MLQDIPAVFVIVGLAYAAVAAVGALIVLAFEIFLGDEWDW